MTFWSNATTEQRLAQIDGGIELLMTSSQIAKNCGTTSHQIKYFSYAHGRKFVASRIDSGKRGSPAKRISLERQKGVSNTEMKDAFSIFDNRPKPSDFLDNHERQL